MSELHGFALWDRASHHFDMMRDYLNNRFEIQHIYKIEWPIEYVATNFNRLYGRDLRLNESRHLQVGQGPFHYFIVKDNLPNYRFHKNVSGKVELVNCNIIDAKYTLRDRTADEFKYYVHSSNSVSEFNKDAKLILGSNFILPNSKSLHVIDKACNFSGADGWTSVDEAFAFCSQIQKIVLLRGDKNKLENETEIDILCEDPWVVAGILNAKKISRENHKYDFCLQLKDGQTIKLDIRCISDDYIPSVWASHIYRNAIETSGLSIIDTQNQYFLNLYHEFLHKTVSRDEKLIELVDQRNKLFFKPLPSQSTQELVSELRGYLIDRNYYVTRPKDVDVDFNRKILTKLLPAVTIEALDFRTRASYKLKLGLSQIIKDTLRVSILQQFWQLFRDTKLGLKIRKIKNRFL